MTQRKDEDRLKKVAEFRSLLEKRIRETEIELEGLQAMLEFVDAELLDKGFRKVEVVKPVSEPSKVMEPAAASPASAAIGSEEPVSMKTVTGDLLATLYVTADSVRIVPAEDKAFDVNTPPFMPFLIERVLAKMQESDQEAAKKGEITIDQILSYDITRDGDTLQQITVKNVRSERLRELKSTVRWTLEKMYEKTQRD